MVLFIWVASMVLSLFNPKNFSENKFIPSVAITDFFLFGKEVYAGEPGSPLEKSITFSDQLVLQSNQNSFSFRVAALDFQAPKTSRIMYKLEGFDTDWLTVGRKPYRYLFQSSLR